MIENDNCIFLLKKYHEATPFSRQPSLIHFLIHRAHIVPAFSFNETHIYDQYDNKLLLQIQDKICRITKIRPVIPKGRGIFQNTFGFLPKKASINTVGE